jgi:hypothetical protein
MSCRLRWLLYNLDDVGSRPWRSSSSVPLEFPEIVRISRICHLSKLVVVPPGLPLVPIRGLLVAPGFPTLLDGCRAGDDGGPVDVRRTPLLLAGAVARRLTTILEGFMATCCCL